MGKKVKISVREAGDYFRGLLLLIRKDGQITEQERMLVNRIGRSLGFEKYFCETAIHEILENEHVSIDPPIFSSMDLAKSFIKDGLLIAESDKEFHGFEEEWLQTTAEKNSVDIDWFNREKELVSGRNIQIEDSMEVDNISVNY